MASAAPETPEVWRGRPLFSEALWRQAPRRSPLLLSLLFGAETLLLALVRWPTDLNFDANAFGDRGDFLTICYLVRHGSRPAIDFGYHWGLLPIMLGQGWYAMFGATPLANNAAMVVCALALAWGMARLAAALRLGLLGVVFLVIALPFTYPTL